MATTKPTYSTYRNAELDSARRRGRYYQQLSYKLSRDNQPEQAMAMQVQANIWFDVFEVKCQEFEDPEVKNPNMEGVIA